MDLEPLQLPNETNEPSSLQGNDWIHALEEQRRSLSSHIARCFFFHQYPPLYRCDGIVRWDYYCQDGEQYIRCFPIQIANFPGCESLDIVLGAVLALTGVEDLIAMSSYSEADTSTTVNIGLRYPEDALIVWSILHGIRCGDRIWKSTLSNSS